MKSHRLITALLITISILVGDFSMMHYASVNGMGAQIQPENSLTPSSTEFITDTPEPSLSETCQPEIISTTAIPTDVTETISPDGPIGDTDTPTTTGSLTSTVTQQYTDSHTTPLLVKVDPDMAEEVVDQLVDQFTLETDTNLDQIQVLIVNIPVEEKNSIKTSLKQMDGIEYIEDNFAVHALGTLPDDPLLASQYGLQTTGILRAWANHPALYDSPIVAVVDSGIDFSSPDFSGRLLAGYDFVNDDAIPQDDYGHGTHVAGIAAASGNDGVGTAGVAWNASVLPVKVLDRYGDGSYANVAKGIIYAADQGAEIINLSLGGPKYSQVLEDAVTYAVDHGSIVVAASGNAGVNKVYYPAALTNVIAVGAVDGGNNYASFSNFGNEIDLAAPGVNIVTSAIGGSYTSKSGTSMSAPFVSGSLAYIESAAGVNAYTAYSSILTTALDLGAPGPDIYYGYGLIQVDRAVDTLIVIPTATPKPTRKSTTHASGQGGNYQTTPTLTASFVEQTGTIQTGTPVDAGSEMNRNSTVTDEVSALGQPPSSTPFRSDTPSRMPTASVKMPAEKSPSAILWGIGLVILGVVLLVVRKRI
jgi:thermitase